ncbi:MAG: hypothetical protein IIA59_06845 [Candidatus Marinimicrobia bacterium]|nr:hypothetical protein [Candidatus Neomarinimicrobiota bacterium]
MLKQKCLEIILHPVHMVREEAVLHEAAALFDLKVLDHIIVAGNEHYSFLEAGMMKGKFEL